MSPTWSVEGLEATLDRFRLGPLDLTLSAGRALAVLGPSGAGKTTLLRTLAGFLAPSRGRILRDGQDVTNLPPEERGLGYVPQGLGLFPHRTVEANVRFPLEVRGRTDAASRTAELLRQFDLDRLARRYPARLSGGEQQRVALARALAAEPTLVLWDEPWQGLDVMARHDLSVTLQELRERAPTPIVVVTHDPSLAFSVAESFLVLGEGRVREQCDAPTLLRSPGDPFVARFIGFENVFGMPTLRKGSPGTLRGWLSSHAGPEGVAFVSPALRSGGDARQGWEGQVRSVRPHPEGLSVELIADELRLVARVPSPSASSLPPVGSIVRFDLSVDQLIPLRPHSSSSMEGG